ncbi:MAG: dephospho-CoA kinase [Deltaproteobacteria bacterium CG_4_10_14_0_2_um_filter_43_8]|nr:MAG: dephospho-CoA kinase [Deltaproteobacteria bacterium CG11_big_fil_rev_8_21_14_0_20_42_23]PJA22011.1 MAG: dephospho-CoA kinase [Deltaproteobacteria bacterium CG_4_10_14_0_2_um_filter_43_8]PJC65236.1 MAG: dephospho-CoA kinase [Deltaproteobacteria bacterium CG_4_9_14_0_2_um_filter_42_21]
MKTIGITGSIGSGKSTVSDFFATAGFPAINADTITHELFRHNPQVHKQVLKVFGESILNENKKIDRKKLGKIIFKDSEQKRKLESILHPLIKNEIFEQIEKRKQRGDALCFVDIPLLYEGKWEEKLDYVIVVNCTLEESFKRAQKKLGISLEEVKLRYQQQIPLDEKVKRANFVINNSLSLENTQLQVDKLLEKLL